MNPNAALIAYIAWMVFAVVLALVALAGGRTRATRVAPPVERLDLYEAAFLCGGPARVADIAVLALRATGAVHLNRDGTVTATGRPAADLVTAGVLRAVQRAGGSAPLAQVRHAGARCPEVQAIGDGLAECGLMRHDRVGRLRKVARNVMILSAVLTVAGVVPPLAPNPSEHPGLFAGTFITHIFGLFVSISFTVILSMRPRGRQTVHGALYVTRLRREPLLQMRLDGTAAGGAGLGVAAVWGLGRLTDPEVLDIFRRQRAEAFAHAGSDASAAVLFADGGDSAGSDGRGDSWCGAHSCADSGFKGSSCSGPNCSSSSWSCAGSSSSCSSSSGSSCSSGGGSSCGSSS